MEIHLLRTLEDSLALHPSGCRSETIDVIRLMVSPHVTEQFTVPVVDVFDWKL